MKHTVQAGFQTEKKNLRKMQARRNVQAGKALEQNRPCGFAAVQSGALQRQPAAAAKRRRGRPRIEGKLREANGRISRAANPPALQALKARALHTGLTVEQAKDQRAGSYLGRLAILGRGDGLSSDQYEAAQQFLQLRNDYQKALLSPGAYYEATGIRLNDDTMAEYEAWVARVKKRYAAALKAIQETQMDNGHENIYAALQYVLIGDMVLPYLLGAVRLLLNALHRHFKRSGGSIKSGWADKYGIALAGLGVRAKILQ